MLFLFEAVKQKYEDDFIAEMDNDFNTPRAIATLFELAREINRCKEINIDVSEAQSTLIKLASILGISIQSTNQQQDTSKTNISPVIVSIHKQLSEAGLHELAKTLKSDSINSSSIPIQTFEPDNINNEANGTSFNQSNLIDILIKVRSNLRISKEFRIADEIRTELEESGIILEDKNNETVWKLK